MFKARIEFLTADGRTDWSIVAELPALPTAGDCLEFLRYGSTELGEFTVRRVRWVVHENPDRAMPDVISARDVRATDPPAIAILRTVVVECEPATVA